MSKLIWFIKDFARYLFTKRGFLFFICGAFMSVGFGVKITTGIIGAIIFYCLLRDSE